MLVFTAKLNKKKLIAALLLLVIVVAAAVLLFSGGASDDGEAAPLSAVVKNNDQRVAFLRSLGWEVEEAPLEEQNIVIPKTFDDVYSEYNAIQKAQGFDLKEYGGLDAVRYTYRVLNHPSGNTDVVVDIIVYRDKVIAGDVQSIAIDGFMEGLAFPDSSSVK